MVALVFHGGFETGDFSEFITVSGAPSVQSAIKKTGTYAMRVNPTADNGYVKFVPSNVPRLSFYFYIATAPDIEASITSVGTLFLRFVLTPDRYLKLYEGISLVGTSSQQLELDTWYRICGTYDGAKARAYIGGDLEIGPTTVTDVHFNESVGIYNDVTADFYFDDIVTDDAESADDIGDIRILAASPNAAGQYAEYDQTSGYALVDEMPADDADYTEDDGSDLARECYNLEDASTIGIGGSDTVKAVAVRIRSQRDTGGGTDHKILVRDNGADYASADLAFNTAWKWFSKYYVVMPDDSAAWTQARFNSFQVGSQHLGAQDQRISCVVVMVAYSPVAVARRIFITHSG